MKSECTPSVERTITITANPEVFRILETLLDHIEWASTTEYAGATSGEWSLLQDTLIDASTGAKPFDDVVLFERYRQ